MGTKIIEMKYLKRDYIIDTMYLKVVESDQHFHKGLALGFNKDESKVKGIYPDHWMDHKSVSYLISEISEKEFNEKYKKAIKYLNTL